MDYELKVKVGNDIGNSEHDIVINELMSNQPNIYVQLFELPRFNLFNDDSPEFYIKDIENKLLCTIKSPSVTNGIYYCGRSALDSGKTVTNIQVGASADKTKSDVVIINTLAQIAAYGTKLLYKEDSTLKGKLSINVDMAVSIPIDSFTPEAAKHLYDRFLGTHEVTVHVGPHECEVEIIFDFIKVMPESISIIFYLLQLQKKDPIFKEFNSLYSTSIDGSFFKDKKILHVAIGEGTTEYPVTEGLNYNRDFVTGSVNGVGHPIEEILPQFKKRLNLKSLTRQKFSDILKNDNHKYNQIARDYLRIPLSNESIEILKIVETEIEKANNEVDIILVHGGGSILMRSHLYDKLLELCNKLDIFLFYVPKENAVTLEAKGLFDFTNSKIFETIKQKSLKLK